MNDFCISVTLFYKSKFRMQPFKRLLCIRAEKNLELSKTSKMEPLEKIVKIFCNNIYLRCLTGFKYTSEDYLFWKYPEI